MDRPDAVVRRWHRSTTLLSQDICNSTNGSSQFDTTQNKPRRNVNNRPPRRGPKHPTGIGCPPGTAPVQISVVEAPACVIDVASSVTSACGSGFAGLALSATLLRAVRDEGYEIPTPIQSQAIPPALEGRDILGCAQTGTGKTAAFALPVLHKLHEAGVAEARGYREVRVLVLCPTRELAGQISDSFSTYGRYTQLRHTVVYGGVSQQRQERALSRGVDVLVATPGRLIDLVDQGIIDLSEVRTFILDEADRMLDMGFIQPIRRIAAMLAKQRQTMLFSATMPREIEALAGSLLNHPVRVTVSPVASAAPLIEQSVYMVGRDQKQALLHHLIGEHGIERTLVFTRTKHGADRVTHRLNRAGIVAEAIHGNKSQNQRQRALDGFRSGRSRVLVATDVAARGLDIDNVTHVFNFDLPNDPEAYVHRIGRTGRAGATGSAIAFCDRDERAMLREIEKLTGCRIAAITNLPELPRLEKLEPGVVEREVRSPTGPKSRRPHTAPRPGGESAQRRNRKSSSADMAKQPSRKPRRRAAGR